MAFLETPRFPEDISYGSSGGPMFNTTVVTTAGSTEYRNANWAYPRHEYDVSYGVRTYAQHQTLLDYFYTAAGKTNGFRFKDPLDFKSCVYGATLADTDQSLGTGDGTTVAFQMIKTYINGALSLVRRIKRPVVSTTVLAIDTVSQAQQWTIDTTTGIITFDADQQTTITDATDASPCVITAASHGLVAGDSVYLSTFTGDWTALNGVRYNITYINSSSFSIAVDTSTYTAYSGNAGQINTIPQTAEAITTGYEFDVPVRFDTDTIPMNHDSFRMGSSQMPLIELVWE